MVEQSRPRSQWELGMTTSERMATKGIPRQWVWDTDMKKPFMFDGVTYGGIAVGGGGEGSQGPPGPPGPPGPAGSIPSGFVWQDGKLYWSGAPIAPTIFIPDGKKLYLDNVTGELVIQ